MRSDKDLINTPFTTRISSATAGIRAQEPYLFPWTIRENLHLAQRQISEELMKRVLRTARAEFILELPDGLDKELSERGESLSGGQRRLCIARALLLQPRLLILDEPSASLDALTEPTIYATTVPVVITGRQPRALPLPAEILSPAYPREPRGFHP